MSPQMRKRIFETEEKLIKKIDEKKEVAQDTWSFYCDQAQYRTTAKSHSVYYA